MCSLHLAEELPDAIIIDAPHLLKTSAADTPSPQGVQLLQPSQRPSPQKPSPASYRPAHRHELMNLACTIALAAHAADGLTHLRGLASGGPAAAEGSASGASSPLAPCVLCVGCTERLFEPEVPSRWLGHEVCAHPRLGFGRNEFVISSSSRPNGEQGLPIAFTVTERRIVAQRADASLVNGLDATSAWRVGVPPPLNGTPVSAENGVLLIGAACGA